MLYAKMKKVATFLAANNEIGSRNFSICFGVGVRNLTIILSACQLINVSDNPVIIYIQRWDTTIRHKQVLYVYALSLHIFYNAFIEQYMYIPDGMVVYYYICFMLMIVSIMHIHPATQDGLQIWSLSLCVFFVVSIMSIPQHIHVFVMHPFPFKMGFESNPTMVIIMIHEGGLESPWADAGD